MARPIKARPCPSTHGPAWAEPKIPAHQGFFNIHLFSSLNLRSPTSAHGPGRAGVFRLCWWVKPALR